MKEYHDFLQAGGKQSSLAADWTYSLAERIIKALDAVILQTPWLPFAQAMEHYRRTIQSAGSGFEKMLSERKLKEILERKHGHGVL